MNYIILFISLLIVNDNGVAFTPSVSCTAIGVLLMCVDPINSIVI